MDSELRMQGLAEIPFFHRSGSGVQKDYFQLTLQVPSFVQQEMPSLSREQEMALEVEGVMKLMCGEYRFLFDDVFAEKPQFCTNASEYSCIHGYLC